MRSGAGGRASGRVGRQCGGTREPYCSEGGPWSGTVLDGPRLAAGDWRCPGPSALLGFRVRVRAAGVTTARRPRRARARPPPSPPLPSDPARSRYDSERRFDHRKKTSCRLWGSLLRPVDLGLERLPPSALRRPSAQGPGAHSRCSLGAGIQKLTSRPAVRCDPGRKGVEATAPRGKRSPPKAGVS